MKWTEHETSAHEDPKVRKLIRKHGAAAYGLYWFIVELIGQGITVDNPENGYLPTDVDGEFLALELGMEQEDVKAVLNYAVVVGLFQREGDRLRCDAILSRCDGYTRKQIAKSRDSVRQSPTKSDTSEAVEDVSEHPSISSSESSSESSELVDNSHKDVAFEWYRRFNDRTVSQMRPSEKDNLKAKDLCGRLDRESIERCMAAYWEDGHEWWFVKDKRSGRVKYSFGSFCANVAEILSVINKPAVEAGKVMKCPKCGDVFPANTVGTDHCLKCGLEKSEWKAYRETHPEAHV